MFKTILAIALCTMAFGPAHANLKEDTKVGRFGNWTILRGVDKMTDKVTCTGVYQQDYTKQLSGTGLYISVKGGISSVTLRFDESSPLPMRLARQDEKDIRAIILDGSAFDLAVISTRLRVQVGTLISGLQDFELNLTGITDAVENIRAGCPPPDVVSSVVPTTSPPLTTSEPPACSPDILSRMKAVRITSTQIQKICAPTDSRQ